MENIMEQQALPSLKEASPLELACAIGEVLDAKKGHEVRVLHVEDKTSIADYFVLCTGTATTQIKGYAGELEYRLGEAGVKPFHVDGYETGMWIAMDYAHVIVHIFHKNERDFYKLEKLWNDAEEIPLALEA